MILLAAYSDNGWLACGHSIRMAQELGLDRAFDKLMHRLGSGAMRPPSAPASTSRTLTKGATPTTEASSAPSPSKSAHDKDGKQVAEVGADGLKRGPNAPVGTSPPPAGSVDEQRELARNARIWFWLFVLDHQTSFGAGRPAMLSKHYVANCRAFLNLKYPLSVKTDARFVSTLELLVIREEHYDAMSPYDAPVDARMLARMRRVTADLDEWMAYWSTELANRGWGEGAFFQQSLKLQRDSADLYLSCTALRGVHDANDALQMGSDQRELIMQATRAAERCLHISVSSEEYYENLRWAPQ